MKTLKDRFDDSVTPRKTFLTRLDAYEKVGV